MSDEGVCKTAPATPSQLHTSYGRFHPRREKTPIEWDFLFFKIFLNEFL